MGDKKEDRQWMVVPKTLLGPSLVDLAHEQEYLKQLHLQEKKHNAIRTSKYSWLTFLPKNLFEQFHRFANIYFLCIIILNWLPAINAFGKEIAMLPLLFVLSVTAVKDLFEDRRRHTSDKEVNNRRCSVYSRTNQAYTKEKWHDITVGDIIRLSADDAVPADILLLNSSDEGNICYVSTASLDGETNLKQKHCVKFKNKRSLSDFLPSDVKFVVQCERPNNQIHNFSGHIELPDGRRMPVDRNHLLLRGSMIRNTETVEGLVIYSGHDTKAMLNNSGQRYKRSKLERDINKDVLSCVFILLILCTAGGIGCGLWTEHFQELNKELALTDREPGMEGFVRFWTFIIVLQVIIPVSLYVSVELVKLGQVYFINQDIEMFYEPAANFSVCRATTINEDLGQIQYVFSDKTGTLTENKMILKRFTVLGSDYSMPDDTCQETAESNCRSIQINTVSDSRFDFKKTWSDFFIGIAICNTVVVIDSYKSIDSVGSRDNEAYDDSTIRRDNNSSVNRGIVNRTNMKHASSHSGISSHGSTSRGNLNRSPSDHDNIQSSDCKEFHDEITSPEPFVMYRNGHHNEYGAPQIHSHISSTGSIRSRSQSTTKTPKLNSIKDRPKYEAESPDEDALVKAAFNFGFKLKARVPGSVRLQLPNDNVADFELLHTLNFDSARKRMSVIVKDPNGKIRVFCKGADTSVMSRLRNYSDPSFERTELLIQEYAHEGLRTLCIAKKDLDVEEYAEWAKKYKEAELALENKDEKLAELVDMMENDLDLLGATAVEDKLQDGVSDTIASLREAGIKVWVLTGDKQETAINIAFSSKLLDESMEITILNANSMEECDEQLDSALQRLASLLPKYTFSPEPSHTSSSLALVVNGSTLAFALTQTLRQKFIDLAECCSAVLCCRAAPIQKARVVKLVRENLKAMCLAIGDGANDVSMLQMADVGVGIVGNEGMQAVMASDFVIGRFKFLKRLLLLHGHWCYDRLARMIVYFFYKNALFVLLLFWYQLFNGFSGSNAIDDFSLIFFNLIFTSTPPIITGILDQCTSSTQLLTKPHLYKRGQSSEAYTRSMFWINMLDSLYQSAVLFAFPYFVYNDTNWGMATIGILFHQIAVITVTLHLGIEIPSWTGVHHFFLWGSIILSYIWFLGLSTIIQSYRTYWVFYNAAATSDFWLLTMIAPVVAVAPRYLYRCIQSAMFPTETILSKMEGLLASRHSHQSIRKFGSGTFHQTHAASYEDIA